MGSRKGLLKGLRPHEIVLPVPKGSRPMTRDEINEWFAAQRKYRDAGSKKR